MATSSSTTTRRLTLAQARRVAIHAQGLARTGRQARPSGAVTMAHLQRTIDRVGLFQIDSVNVIARAHLLPAFSRLGPYDAGLIDRASRGTPSRPRRLMESWAHVAAYVPPETFHLLRYRMRRFAERGFAAEVRTKHPEVYAHVLDVVAEQGPITAGQMHELLGHERGPKEHWGWNWSVAKQVLEACFFTGELAVAHRTSQFERAYDLTERVLPPALVGLAEVEEREAVTTLVDAAARAHGIGTIGCFADYFRMSVAQATAAVQLLVERGRLEPVEVSGWSRPVYLHAEASLPRVTHARALLAPFDPLVFERRRLLELFGMHYRIGIYTPAAQRTDGYYVLPFLLGDQVAGRTDLKADRARGTLVVRTAFKEAEGPAAPVVASEMAEELRASAQWLGLSRIEIADDARGDLVGALRHVL
ncbi:winged helix-turn-helix domain-containing protein [Pseudactinotalea suaedae]|uniref:winged helix-turn-helix domain-containing protein n=1 Tax=Pseudactinotalea suaedae TaxID=1524924 RepID=UPI0012E2ADDC|nr:crosslink repair DNA glycosylase YcaQ family protein [Pseudactinotalea suaedae]